jgi:apolipoprotein N-acyltransferase
MRPRIIRPGTPREGAGDGRWAGRAAAFALGMPLALAFPKPALWWLAFVALVPLLLLVRAARDAREAGIRCWLGGSAFFLTVDSWLIPNARIFAIPAALVLGLLWLPWGRLAWTLLHGQVSPGRLGLAMLLVPSAFVLTEVIRSLDWLGGPWALLGASQWNDRPILALASVGGVWAVSFLLAAVNVALAVVVGWRVPVPVRRRAALAAGGLVLASLAWWSIRPAPLETGRTVRVALVQPGKIDDVQARLRASESLSLGLAGAHPDLIVWSESSVGRDPTANPADMARLRQIVARTGADVLAGVDSQRQSAGGGIYKSSLLIGPGGPIASYDKIRLVPFGEYVPMRPLLGWVSRFTDAAATNRHRGRHLELMHARSLTIGPLICFESSFPDLSRNLARLGADLVVVQSATTTFQSTWGPQQHASLAAVRAVESGRPVVQASIAGVSAAFDPQGRMLAWRPTTWRGAVVVDIRLSRETTLYDRFGAWVPGGSAVALALAAALALRRRTRTAPLRSGPGATDAPGRRG